MRTIAGILLAIGALFVADQFGFGDLADAVISPDYLGNPAQQALKGQPALPTGGPVAAGVSPGTSPKGTSEQAEGAGGGQGGTVSRTGGMSDVQKAKLAFDLAKKAADAGKDIFGGRESTGRDEQSFQEQRGGERADYTSYLTPPLNAPIPDNFATLPTGPTNTFGSFGAEEAIGDIPTVNPTAGNFTGAFGAEEAVGTGAGAAAADVGASTGAEVATEAGALGDFAPYIAPIIQSVGTGLSIAERAQTGMDPGEQAAFAAGDLLTQGIPVFGSAIQMGLGRLWQKLWEKSPSHEQRDMADFSEAGRYITSTLPDIAAAGDYNTLAAALTPIFKSRYAGKPYALVPGVAETSYNMGEEGMMNLPSREGLAQLFAGKDPNAISIDWQQGIRPEDKDTINNFMNTTLRRQVGLIRAANAGDPTARMLLSQAQQKQAASQADVASRAQSAFDEMTQQALPTMVEGN